MVKKIFLMFIASISFILLLSAPTFAGNGAPSGSHYNLNIIGMSKDKNADMTGSNGHVIFVNLDGNTKIMLCESGVGGACTDVDGFQVLDADGTDGVASFALPNPDPTNSGTTTYSVFARALGKPGGSSKTTTCATDPTTGETVCSVITLELKRTKGQSVFQNVSKYLLYIYVDLNGDGVLERYNLFNDKLQDYFWSYDNTGLRIAQFRFYPCATIVPDPTDPNGAQIDTACFK